MMVSTIGNLVSCIVNEDAPEARRFEYGHPLQKIETDKPFGVHFA
jgi:hypothetical protein